MWPDAYLLQVEGTLYNVHRYFFERDSSYFRSILEKTDTSSPLVLPDVSSSDFAEFLAILYPACAPRAHSR